MPSRYRSALILAALAVAARLPFLLSGKIAFDADEAVEGLMARHVLQGELPAFFWGQAFKGVPEVYASAAAFALFGSSVLALKSVTLIFFACFVFLNFILIERMAGHWTAWAATLLLIAAPPALVFWSLDASAEYVLLMLLGTILLLLCSKPGQSAVAMPPRRLAAVGLVVGLALWVQQLFVVYLVPIAIVLLVSSRIWRERRTGRVGTASLLLASIAGVYFLLAVIAFMTGGFTLSLGTLTLGARAPQKMLRVALGIGAIAGLLEAWRTTEPPVRTAFLTRLWPLGMGFLAGYAPVIIYSVLVEPAHSPLRNANLQQLIGAAPDIFRNVLPILGGFRLATTERMPLPIVAALPGVAALLAYVWSQRARLVALARSRAGTIALARDFFPLFVVLTPIVVVIGGAYLDTQSYRYFIPYYAGLSIAWAGGSLYLARGRRIAATVLVGAIALIHVWQQVVWYGKLQPDTVSIETIRCLERQGILGGYADYWTSYKLTFLSNEAIVIAPTNGVDRYPRYTEYVRSLPDRQRTPDAAQCRK